MSRPYLQGILLDLFFSVIVAALTNPLTKESSLSSERFGLYVGLICLNMHVMICYKVKDKIPSLGQLGGTQLYPADPSTDRRPALLSILKSLLVTYSFLTSSLLAPPPTNSAAEIPPKWHRHTEWIAVLSQNILAAANDLRPVQVSTFTIL